MLVGSLRGLGKRGKKKQQKKGSENCRKLQKFAKMFKNFHLLSEICKKFTGFVF
jgi:hypothetical protein